MPSNDGMIHIIRLNRERRNIWIVGTAPLIVHKWTEKALRGMPGHPDAGAERMTKKGKYNPVEEATAATYRLREQEPIVSGNAGFPATAFKAATIGACRLFKEPTMELAKRLIFVEGVVTGSYQLIPLFFRGEPQLREDVTRLQKGGNQLCYRYQFFPWWVCLPVLYLPTNITEESIVSLVDAGGLGGVGEWRPSAPKSLTGTYGTYRVMLDEEKKEYGVE